MVCGLCEAMRCTQKVSCMVSCCGVGTHSVTDQSPHHSAWVDVRVSISMKIAICDREQDLLAMGYSLFERTYCFTESALSASAACL